MPLLARLAVLRVSVSLGAVRHLTSNRSTGSAAAPAFAAATHGATGMGQKSLDTFFKRPAATAVSSKASEAGAMSGKHAAAAMEAQPAPAQSIEAGADAHLPSASAPAAAAAEGSSRDGKGDVPAGSVPQAQHSEQQLHRSHANRNIALAKQVVLRAEAVGGLPPLGELLVEESWRQLLAPELGKPYFEGLEAFVRSEWGGSQAVFPPKHCIFRAFNGCPVERVRVVILGQDPYHDMGQAMGLSFSVPKGIKTPSSLRNMCKELNADLGCPAPTHGNLEKWANQGVLLLNAVLTVRAHTAASHGKKGWEKFTDAAISQLSQQRTGIVFLLWGRYAQEKGKMIDRQKHHVLTAAHPSGLSASRGFFGCRHFSQTNELLQKDGQLPIDWCIE